MGGNYEKNLFNHVQELIKQVDFLTAEMPSMKTQYEKEIDGLKKENQQLRKEITSLKQENTKLKDMLSKNSGNSGKPPSSDGFKKIQNSREKSGKRPGGQKGHKGNAPKLYDNPTCTVAVKKEKCECGGRIKYTGKYAAKQLVDVRVLTDITEYREYEGVCECCRKSVSNRAPINDVMTYGSNIKSLSSMLTMEGCVSINRTRQMISELTGGLVNLSEGTIAKWNKSLARCVAPAIDNIKDKLFMSPVLHKDETGIRIDKKLHWLHVLSNAKCTLYAAHKKRGSEADEQMGVLPAYSGVLVHDHLKSLYKFLCLHAECNAHILRYLKETIESKKRRWAQAMIALLLEAKKMGESNNDKPLSKQIVMDFHKRYDEILASGSREFLKDDIPDYGGEDMNLLRRMKKFKTEHLRYVSDPTVPFDNNQAERDLRMIKAKAKISGCFRASDGGEVFAAIKSYSSTLRKNRLNIFEGIKDAFLGVPLLC